jgi:negative regulator of sigma E activity
MSSKRHHDNHSLKHLQQLQQQQQQLVSRDDVTIVMRSAMDIMIVHWNCL